ncbi:sensor histidine kinase [Sphaerisporangium rubeum]|uniref:Anti-sigma regulatory factor (Ser/Thr protein kinase) n=1 Tax=Sphaerisporangium rubeum TaxID=321317 RepID=A0A7X0ID25_9ACTN|nr:sensor histidine kinase [Sphaerisporangium rubeum]MBB6472921.1 anti-sigma regulatory factor (Ser/Thr protein kinase) [Sphaerisporangium rubeum]
MTVSASAQEPTDDPFRHIGLIYRDFDEYAAGCVSFLEQALALGEPALVAVPGDRGELIRSRLGERSADVVFRDMAVAGRNPGRIIPSVLLAFAEANQGRRVWIIGEPIWPGRSPLEYPECVAHEALINTAFTGRDAAILCPYDAAGLDPSAIDDAAVTHPHLQDGSDVWSSTAYGDPVVTAMTFDWPLPAPPRQAAMFPFDGFGSLAPLREFVAGWAGAAGLTEQRTCDLLIAVNELATNTAEYSKEPGTVWMWCEDGLLVCQIDDFGTLDDPMAGRIPPPDAVSRGRGILIVNELADLVRIHRRPGGTSVRIHFELPSPVEGR